MGGLHAQRGGSFRLESNADLSRSAMLLNSQILGILAATQKLTYDFVVLIAIQPLIYKFLILRVRLRFIIIDLN